MAETCFLSESVPLYYKHFSFIRLVGPRVDVDVSLAHLGLVPGVAAHAAPPPVPLPLPAVPPGSDALLATGVAKT